MTPFVINYFSHVIPSCDVWHNTLQNDSKCEQKIITQEIQHRTVSNGHDCHLMICEGEFHYWDHISFKTPLKRMLPVVLKFRMVDQNTQHMTEREGQHMINASKDVAIKDLFPELYFLMSVVGKFGFIWEVIGSEKMIAVDHNFCPMPDFYREACDLLRMLHIAGYKHGDPHCNNFMMTPPHSNHKLITPHGILFIDQDETEKLPVDPDKKAVYNMYVIIDLLELMSWGNPYCNFYSSMVESDYKRAFWILQHMNGVYSAARPPWPLSYIRELSVSEMSKLLDSHPQYKAFLEQWSLVDIHNFFTKLLYDPREMKMVDGLYMDYLKRAGIRYKG